MSVAPDDAQGLLSRAQSALELRDLQKASAFLERAALVGAHPDVCSAVAWQIAMLRGDFHAAWAESDAIRRRGSHDPHRFWRGEDFGGKRVMLRCLHGHGDTVQMMRYASMIAAQARSLTVEVAPPMLELVRLFDGVDRVITWGEEAPEAPPEWDVQMEVNELPYIFRTLASDLPLTTNYLKITTSLLGSVDTHARRADHLRVGLVWASGEWNATRSVPLQLLDSVTSVAGVEFWNLQGGSSRTEWSNLRGSVFHDADECTASIPHLAALVAQLDLVITTDTLAAHLAGALGTPAWIMLGYAADWRWQHERRDSPWYPSLRLFRQRWHGDWASVVDQVASELNQIASNPPTFRKVA